MCVVNERRHEALGKLESISAYVLYDGAADASGNGGQVFKAARSLQCLANEPVETLPGAGRDEKGVVLGGFCERNPPHRRVNNEARNVRHRHDVGAAAEKAHAKPFFPRKDKRFAQRIERIDLDICFGCRWQAEGRQRFERLVEFNIEHASGSVLFVQWRAESQTGRKNAGRGRLQSAAPQLEDRCPTAPARTRRKRDFDRAPLRWRRSQSLYAKITRTRRARSFARQDDGVPPLRSLPT